MTKGSIHLSVGGSGLALGDKTRDSAIDTRHMIAFLADIADCMTTQNIIIESRWKETLGLLETKLYPTYSTAFGKFFFMVYDNIKIKNIIESHVALNTLREYRHESGVHKTYCDY